MKENLMKFYSVLVNDENIKRMLYYQPLSYSDDPLSTDKDDVSSLPNHWEIVNFRIKKTAVIADIIDTNNELEKEEFCRILMYPDSRRTTTNYMLANQDITFDIWAHWKFDEKDFRLSMISDRIADLFHGKSFKDVGEVRFVNGRHLGTLRDGKFVGYQVTYELGDFQW